MRIRRYIIPLLAIVIIFEGICLPALAHDTGLSGIRILYRRHDVVINVTTPLSKLAQGEPGGKTVLTPVEIDQAIRRRLRLQIGEKSLIPRDANIIGDNVNDIISWQTVVIGPVPDIEVLARLYPEQSDSRTTLSIVREGQTVQDILLDADHPDFLRNQPSVNLTDISFRYIRDGISHILSGADHILFVVGMLLLGGTLKSLLRTVTAFTLAHSMTLCLAVMGVVTPSPRLIEPLIALSIFAIAVENLRLHFNTAVVKKPDARPLYAFAFGLIHGFGFAGALADISLPASSVPLALGSFNIGVEIGQASIILALFPLLAYCSIKKPEHYRIIAFVGSAVIGVVGAGWFILRLL